MESPLQSRIVTETGVAIDPYTKWSIAALFQTLSTVEGHESVLVGQEKLDLDAYFDFYIQQCQIFLAHRGSLVTVRTHQDIVDLFLDFHRNLDRQELKALLSKRLQHGDGTNQSPNVSEAVLDSTIDLGARLFLMMRVGDVPHSIASGKGVQWTQGNITQFVRQRFEVPPGLSCDGVKLPRLFNARNLVRIGGLEIAWTTSLEDHLRVVDDDEKVKVFGYPSFLMLHLNSGVFPDGFVEETLQTLKLLFPANDKTLSKWIQSLPPEVDRNLATFGSLRAELRHIEKFRYWRDRLVILKEVFDEAEPSSLSQWWYDRRKKVQWYTWWLAVLVLLLGSSFGIVQIVEGALQVYKAFNP